MDGGRASTMGWRTVRSHVPQVALSTLFGRWIDRRFGLFAIGPTVLAMLIIFGLPLVFSLFLSFRGWSIDQSLFAGRFVGFQNYQDLITDAEFMASLVRAGLPIGLHVGGPSASAPSASGWPSFYVEEHQILSHSMPTQAASLILEGVFDRFPRLTIVMIEGGFAWVPTLCWRLDAAWSKMRSEVPDLKLKPSEYFRRNLWFATQPMEEPEKPRHLRQVFDWIGWDRMVYSSDYPHWDYDDPQRAIKVAMTEAERRAIFRKNALAIYRFD